MLKEVKMLKLLCVCVGEGGRKRASEKTAGAALLLT